MLIMISFSEFFFFFISYNHTHLFNKYVFKGQCPCDASYWCSTWAVSVPEAACAQHLCFFFIWKSAESHRDAQIEISAAVKYLVAPITWASNHVAHQENRRGVAASSHSNLGEMFSVRLCDVCCNSEVNWSHANIKSVSAEDASFWFRG